MIRIICVIFLLVVITNCRNIKLDEDERGNTGVSGQKVIKSLKFTPCLDKDCTKRSHHRKNHRRHHRRRGQLSPTLPASSGFSIENEKSLPDSKGIQLPSEDSRILHQNYKDEKSLPASEKKQLPAEDPSILYQNYGWNMDAKVPRGVSRLESKMHPNIRNIAKEFMDSLQSVLLKIQGKIRRVDDEYLGIGSKSRDAMVAVRTELEQITKENNIVYDVLLDVSQLVRYVYRRAHEHGIAGAQSAMAIRNVPVITRVNLQKQLAMSRTANHNASIVYNGAMYLKRRGIQQDDATSGLIKEVRHKSLAEKFRYFEIYDLRQKIHAVITKVDVMFTNILLPVKKRIIKYKTSINNVTERIQHAKYLSGLAHEATKTAKQTYQLNKKFHDSAMQGRGRRRRPVRSTDHARLENLVQRAIRRSKQLEDTANIVQSKLSELLPKAKQVIKKMESGGTGLLTEVKGILVKVASTVAKLDDQMDEIRVFLNDSRMLEKRCEEVEGTSSVIQCEKYGFEELSGSGNIDVDDLFTHTYTRTPTPKVITTDLPISSERSTPSTTVFQSSTKTSTHVVTSKTTTTSPSTTSMEPSSSTQTTSTTTSEPTSTKSTTTSSPDTTSSHTRVSTSSSSSPSTLITQTPSIRSTHAPSTSTGKHQEPTDDQETDEEVEGSGVSPTKSSPTTKSPPLTTKSSTTTISSPSTTIPPSTASSSSSTSSTSTTSSQSTTKSPSTTSSPTTTSTPSTSTSTSTTTSSATNTSLPVTSSTTTALPTTTITSTLSTTSKAQTPSPTRKTTTNAQTFSTRKHQTSTDDRETDEEVEGSSIESSGDFGFWDESSSKPKTTTSTFKSSTNKVVDPENKFSNKTTTTLNIPSTTASTTTSTVKSTSEAPSSTSTTTQSVTTQKELLTSMSTTTPVPVVPTTEEIIDEGSGESSAESSGDFSFGGDSSPKPKTNTPSTTTTTTSISPTTTTIFVDKNEEDKEEEDLEDGWGGWLWGGDDPNVLYDPGRDFKEKLSKAAFLEKQKSEKIHAHWMNVSVSFEKIQRRWDGVNQAIMYLQKYNYGAEALKVAWNTENPVITRIHNDISNKTSGIKLQSEMAINKSDNALKIINKKLADMIEIKESKLKQSDASGNQGAAFIADFISKVQMVDQNAKEIVELQKINASPCLKVQNTATRLRNSIAQLRSKINKAKTIAESIPLTVSLSGNDYVRAVSYDDTLSVQTQSSVEMCIKPDSKNMQIASIFGNQSQSFSIWLENSKPVLSVKDTNGLEKGTVEFETELKMNLWQSMKLTRVGRTVEMKLKNLNGSFEEIVEDSYLPEIAAINFPITEAIIGKTITSSENPLFSGCIGDFLINGRATTISKAKGRIQPCTSGKCGSKNNIKSMVFEGDGFALFPVTLVDASYIDNIHITFQTSQMEGVILFINDKHKLLQILITLSKGSIHIEVRTRRGTDVLTSQRADYSNGQPHFLKIVFGNDEIDATTDLADTFEQEFVRQEIPRISDGIYLGGLDVQSHSLSGKHKLRSFTGCISSVTISNREIYLFMIERSRHVYFGNCNESIWRKCVKMTDKSKPVKFEAAEDNGEISIIFQRDSIGSLLNLGRIKGEDFDFTFIYDGKDNLEILDNKNDKEYKLSSTDQDKDWHVLAVHDTDSEKILVNFDSSTLEVPYDEKWRWLSVDLEYDLTVAGLPDSDTATFIGGISSIIRNDRAINLQEYIDSHNLHPCEKTTKHMEAEKEEKPRRPGSRLMM